MNPISDVLLFVLLCVIALVSLTFRPRGGLESWDIQQPAAVALPLTVAVGCIIANFAIAGLGHQMREFLRGLR